eukprot:jgi/Ulvmu1/6780/UM030_0118.1
MRGEALACYRHLLRGIRSLPPKAQSYYRVYARENMVTWQDEEDQDRIQALIKKANEDLQFILKKDITFDAPPGTVFVVPQGLLHFNHNRECIPNVFFQTFTSADPGAINIVGALAALRDGGEAGAAAIAASGASPVEASPLGSFALDKECLAACGFPATGAPGDGLQDLPDAFRVLFGLGPAGGAMEPPTAPMGPPADDDDMGDDDGEDEVEVEQVTPTGRSFARARVSTGP